MALVFLGQSKCSLCEQILISDDDLIAFPAFLPEVHSLWKYSDAAFHEGCYDAWEHRERFSGLYKRWNEIMDTRPEKMPAPDELAAWYAEAFKDFPGDT